MEQRFLFKIRSCGPNTSQIRKALCASYVTNIAKHDPVAKENGFRTLFGDEIVTINRSSGISKAEPPKLVVYHELSGSMKEVRKK